MCNFYEVDWYYLEYFDFILENDIIYLIPSSEEFNKIKLLVGKGQTGDVQINTAKDSGHLEIYFESYLRFSDVKGMKHIILNTVYNAMLTNVKIFFIMLWLFAAMIHKFSGNNWWRLIICCRRQLRNCQTERLVGRIRASIQ